MSTQRFDAVLFDLDGTLTISEGSIFYAARAAIRAVGMRDDVPDARMRAMIGPPLLASFREIFGMSDATAREAARVYDGVMMAEGVRLYRVYAGMRGLLRALKKRGVYTAVATSKPIAPTARILEHLGLTAYFDTVSAEPDSAPTYGKAELIRRALPAGVDPARAAMVGDRRFDIEGAKACGIAAIGAGYGYAPAGELEQAGADVIAPDVAALTTLLLGEDAARGSGAFLSVEGLDGSGKTTQVNLLEEGLRKLGFDVLRTREPGGCPISEKIRSLVLGVENEGMTDVCEALLYAASRAQHVHEVIRPAVAAGRTVLCDRFVDSSVAYQGGGRRLGVAAVSAINAPAVDGMLPASTVYLRIGHEEALRRRAGASALDRLEREEASFHARVEAAYNELIARDPARFIVVDATRAPEVIARDALRAVCRRLEPDNDWRGAMWEEQA